MNSQPISRRDAITAAGAVAVGASMGGCERLVSLATRGLGQTVPDVMVLPSGADIDPDHHLLNRAAYGPWPGDLEKLRRQGAANWIEEQLHPESIDDHVCQLRARRFEELEQPAGECYEYDKPVLREDMARHSLMHAVYTRRQLYEVMVGFWTDHLNINIEKGDCIYLKPADDRDVIRRHALGKFSELIRASATSAAMLVYLDGNQNRRATPADIPNENYGRELLELHTLGVNGGYTQHDVYEAARTLTGWRVRSGFRKGTVYFDDKLHDHAAKTVLGAAIHGPTGASEVQQLVDVACRHPSTAIHISTKLVKRFVSEDPPAQLVERVRREFTATDGDIRSVLRVLLNSDEFRAARGVKFKTPFRFVASALRALSADTFAHHQLIEFLGRMGQGIFQFPTPDGYPDKAAPWLGTLLWRWNLSFALASNSVPAVNIPLDKLVHATGAKQDSLGPALFRYFAGHDPSPDQAAALAGTTDPRDLAALIIASPAFQRY